MKELQQKEDVKQNTLLSHYNKNTQCFLFTYNDKEQNYKQYTDTKIATIGARCENICNVIIFY